MWKTKSRLLFATGCLASLLVLCVGFIWQVKNAKYTYSHRLSLLIAQYTQQQQALLQRLGNNLLIPLQQNDVAEIARNLRVYEDILYTLAKQNLTIPASVHLVSLNAPQKIIGSYGIAENSVLAPDENYYIQTLENPTLIAQSHIYSKQEMPDYFMLNLGVGVFDSNQIYRAQLDQKIAINTLQDFIKLRLGSEKFESLEKIFTFRFTNAGIDNPEILLSSKLCLELFLRYATLLTLIFTSIFYIVHAFIIRLMLNKQQKLQLDNMQLELVLVREEHRCMRIAAEVQHKYGTLLSIGMTSPVIIELPCLISDIKAVNANLALERSVQLVFPDYSQKALRFYANQIRIMQILSGITYEIIQHMNSAGILELEIQINHTPQGEQILVFIFKDNGFYQKITDREHSQSKADIRCKGWQNICDLIALEQGLLEHQHTVYAGNVTKVSFVRKVVSNVVSLESYLQDA